MAITTKWEQEIDEKKREGYCISYSCQNGSWQPKELSPTESLSKEECRQLDDIIIKLLNNGVFLEIRYKTTGEILNHPYVSKGEASCEINHLGVS